MLKHRHIPLLLKLWLYAYSLTWILFRIICYMLSPFVRSIAKQIKGRVIGKNQLQKIAANRNDFDQAVLFYCSSAGEYEQAKPLIDKMALTHYVHLFFFSVSGYHYAKKLNEQNPFDLVPIDTLWDWKRIFNALRPTSCIIVRHEFWPGFIACAYQYSKVYAIDVSLKENPSNLSLQVKRWLFNCSDFIFFVSEQDHQLLHWKSCHYAIAGNTKFERAQQRQHQRKPVFDQLQARVNSIFPGLKRLIVGSAWTEDIETTLDAYLLLPVEEQVHWRMVIAPHDIQEKMIRTVQDMCHQRGITHQILGNSLEEDTDVLIIAEIGILFELYGCCHAALIGGGFKQGVHNIIEPAVYKIPMASGPFTGSDREAHNYQKKGLLTTVANARELSRWWYNITTDAKSYHAKITAQLNAEQCATDIILKEINR